MASKGTSWSFAVSYRTDLLTALLAENKAKQIHFGSSGSRKAIFTSKSSTKVLTESPSSCELALANWWTVEINNLSLAICFSGGSTSSMANWLKENRTEPGKGQKGTDGG